MNLCCKVEGEELVLQDGLVLQREGLGCTKPCLRTHPYVTWEMNSMNHNEAILQKINLR